MSRFASLRAHGVAAACAVAFALACGLAAPRLAPILGVSAVDLYRDPASAAGLSFAVGWFSTLGIIAWAAAASCCLLAASLTGPPARGPLLLFGLLTSLLGLDDAFLLHEDVLPRLGVKPLVLYVFYFAAALLWAVRYQAVLRRTPWQVCALALACLAGSAFVDQTADFFRIERPIFAQAALMLGVELGPAVVFVRDNATAISLVEDTLKLAGILAWAIYGVGFARTALRGAWAREPAPPHAAAKAPPARRASFRDVACGPP